MRLRVRGLSDQAAGWRRVLPILRQQIKSTGANHMNELQKKRDALANTARSILQKAEVEHRSLTAAEQKDFDGITEKISAVNETLKRAGQLGELRADIERPVTAGRIPGKPGEMRYERSNVTPGEIRTFQPDEAISEAPYSGPGLGRYVRGLVTGRWDGAEQLRALAEGTPSAGGYLVPTPLSAMVIDLVRNQTQVIRAGALTVPMDSATLKMARLASDVTAGWRAENAAITFSDNTFEGIVFTAHTLAAGAKLPVELVEDASNIDSIVGNSIAQSLALELDHAALYGTGSNDQPKGVKNQTGVTITELDTSTTGVDGTNIVGYNEFSRGISALKGFNFPGPFGILASARTSGRIDLMLDTLGQPLRKPPLVEAAQFFLTNQIPNNLTVGSKTTASDAFIGQWDQCMIGMRTGLTMEVSRVAADSTGSAFANAQVWIRAYLRADVQLQRPKAFNILSGIL